MYYEIQARERLTREMLIELEKEDPLIMVESNIDSILALLKKKHGCNWQKGVLNFNFYAKSVFTYPLCCDRLFLRKDGDRHVCNG